MEGYIPLANMILIFIQVLIVGRSSVLALGKNSTCSDGLGLNYTLPMFEVCRERPDENGKIVATIPKIIPHRVLCPNSGGARLSGHRQCKFPDCLSNPCKDGWCEETMVGFKCHCSEGYTGSSCEKLDKAAIIARNETQRTTSTLTTTQQSTTTPDLNECLSQPCLHGGICLDGINSYTCQCKDGWAGTNCGIDIDECSHEPCENGGVCVDGMNRFTCACTEGWEGSTCGVNTNECVGDPCGNGGICQDGNNSYTCQCTLGWEGNKCEINKNDCVNDPCQNEGACLDGLNIYTCQCTDGWEGSNCENDIDECSSQPCGNQGICQDEVNGYTCACEDGWTGTHCETALCPSDWFYYGHKCYYMTSYMHWSDAKSYCGNLNVTLQGGAGSRRASLLLVESHEETEVIAKELLGGSMGRLWLNCNDVLNEGTWICEKDASGTVSSYRNWYPSQPNGGDFALMRNVTVYDHGKWFDRGNCYGDVWCGNLGTVCQVYL